MAAVAATLLAAAAVVVALLWGLRWRRAGMQLRAVVAAAEPGVDPPRGLEAGIERLERRVAQLTELVARRDDQVRELRSAFDGLSVGVVVAAADGSVLTRNGAADRYLGGRHEEVLVAAAAERLVASAGAGNTVREVVQVTGPPRRVVQVSAAPLAGGQRRACVVTIADVTDQIRIDEVRRDFVANLSHELKSPIGAVGVLADALDGESDPATRSRLVSHISAEVTRLDHIIGDLLELSRLEFEGVARRSDVSLVALVDEAVDAVHHRAEQAGVEVHTDAVDVAASLDRVQVVRALCNLLDNAIAYSDPGGKVLIGAERDDERALFTVTDQGIGIPGSDLGRIFERFYRVDAARSRATGGTGLGLAIVRHVAHNHGGEVDVVSREGEGSTFTLSLPAVAEE